MLCDRDLVDSVCEVLDTAGAVATSLEDGADRPVYEPGPGETKLWSTVRVSALMDAGAPVGPLRERLDGVLGRDCALHVEPLPDRDWQGAWRERFGPMRFGSRLWVAPPGESPSAPGAVTVVMEPGLAFGSGSHASTALCLEWLDGQSLEGLDVVDYGCGSGILAIAALKLGARHAYAIDHDGQALCAARENARRNAVSERLTVARPEAAAPRGAELVVANILADPLIELAPRLARMSAIRGRLALAGILSGQAEAVRDAYSAWFAFDWTRSRGEWVCIAGTRNDRPAGPPA